MTELLGEYGEGPEVRKVLDGTFLPPPSASIATKDFLSACKQHEGVGQLSNEKDTVQRYRTNKKNYIQLYINPLDSR